MRCIGRGAVVAVAFSTLFSAGCTPSACDRSAEANPITRYSEGTVEDGVYMSSPWEGDLLYFPGGARYEIEHQLGQVPRWWQAYLSFDRCGSGCGGNMGSLAQAAGNQAEIREVDAHSLVVVNGSCSEYWLLVVAGAGSDEPQAP